MHYCRELRASTKAVHFILRFMAQERWANALPVRFSTRVRDRQASRPRRSSATRGRCDAQAPEGQPWGRSARVPGG